MQNLRQGHPAGRSDDLLEGNRLCGLAALARDTSGDEQQAEMIRAATVDSAVFAGPMEDPDGAVLVNLAQAGLGIKVLRPGPCRVRDLEASFLEHDGVDRVAGMVDSIIGKDPVRDHGYRGAGR